MRPPLLASATSLNFMAEVVNGLSLPTIVASLSVTVCAGATAGRSSTAAVRSTRKRFIEASTAEQVGPVAELYHDGGVTLECAHDRHRQAKPRGPVGVRHAPRPAALPPLAGGRGGRTVAGRARLRALVRATGDRAVPGHDLGGDGAGDAALR